MRHGEATREIYIAMWNTHLQAEYGCRVTHPIDYSMLSGNSTLSLTVTGHWADIKTCVYKSVWSVIISEL